MLLLCCSTVLFAVMRAVTNYFDTNRKAMIITAIQTGPLLITMVSVVDMTQTRVGSSCKKMFINSLTSWNISNGWWRVNFVSAGAPLKGRVVWTWLWYYATVSLKPRLMTQVWFPNANHKTADLKFKVLPIKHSYLWAHMMLSCCPTLTYWKNI